jgi:hypothetical protein
MELIWNTVSLMTGDAVLDVCQAESLSKDYFAVRNHRDLHSWYVALLPLLIEIRLEPCGRRL